MQKILIVSNRLPLQVNLDNESISIKSSVGGLATGIKSIYKSFESQWIGWPGITNEEINNEKVRSDIVSAVRKENCLPVFIDKKDMDLYYYGFSNKTIWPLFHYFTQYVDYNRDFWNSYIQINEKFAEVIHENIKGIDKIWIHDYHLLLLPKLIKDKHKEISIGFFLHIPFPSYEVFRILPWRREIIEGMLGADLIGFHTYDYERHFLSCVRRLLGREIVLNQINMGNRIVKADAFPMGIDYEKYHNSAIKLQQKSIKDKSKIRQEIDKYFLMSPDRKLILSIDRLDYSKGISNRLIAFEYFLDKYPEYREKVTLVLLAVPSRINVEQYMYMKREIDELVGKINGKYATINWTPIWYFYRTLNFEDLIELYTSCEIALITPIRDGMNLVAKEYIASQINDKGVLILSEMAGAAKELNEAIIINPNNKEEIAKALEEAVNMPEEEQKNRINIMQNILKRYNIVRWAQDFINSLENVSKIQKRYLTKKINEDIEKEIIKNYKKAGKRILFLDYDGTLVGFQTDPNLAQPDKELYGIMDKLAGDSSNEIVLISGRDRDIFGKWFGEKKYTLIVEHGVWIKKQDSSWRMIEQMNNEWKDLIRPSIEFFVDRTPGTFIEEKNYSIAWHYRKADYEQGIQRAIELKDELRSLISTYNLDILEGNKVIEIKNSNINKGRAALQLISDVKYDFIVGIGDDWTDEFLFEALPDSAVTIKVGIVKTSARYNVESISNVRELLKKFIIK
jgi:trehalose 6-phosphate synthase/phosphatase